MFKKKVTVSQTSLLGGKDLKSLRVLAKSSCPALSDEQLLDLLPNKSKLTINKMSNKAIVYSLESGDPLFFDPSGHGDRLYPTVYVLARYPNAVESVTTYSPVSGKILGGADLFLQGFCIPSDESLAPSFLANSVRALVVRGNSIPFAIGFMAVSSKEAVASRWQGRGLTILHTFGDLLWQLGSQTPPNEGFTLQSILPLETTPEVAVETSGDGSEEAVIAAPSSSHDDETQEDELEVGRLHLAEDIVPLAPEEESTVSMETALEAAVVAGLQTLKNSELPIQFSDFYSKHMLPHKPSGMTFDLKQSRYKKLSKLLDKFSKDKVITQKVVRKQDTISAVDRNHPVFKDAVNSTSTTNGGQQTVGKPAAPAQNGAPAIECTPCYRVPSSLRPVFELSAGPVEKDQLFSEEEVASALTSYISANGLSDGNGSIKLDATLLSALFGKSKEFSVGSTIPDRVLLTKLKDKLTLHTKLRRQTSEGPVVVVRKGPIPPIQVATSKKRGHPITTVSHVESFGLSAEAFAKDFQKRYGSACTQVVESWMGACGLLICATKNSSAFRFYIHTSCSVAPLPGKQEQDMEVTMQGELQSKVAEYFVKLGIPSSYIQVKGSKK